MPEDTVKKQLVLVEDNQSDVFLVREAIRLRGLSVDLVCLEDVPRALQALSGDGVQPAGILMDLNLPGGDGFDLLRFLRANDRLSGVPITVLTSSDSPQDRMRALRMGIKAYVHKPINLQAFFIEVGNAIEELLEHGKAVTSPTS